MIRDENFITKRETAWDTEFENFSKPLLRLSKSMRKDGTIPVDRNASGSVRASRPQGSYLQPPATTSILRQTPIGARRNTKKAGPIVVFDDPPIPPMPQTPKTPQTPQSTQSTQSTKSFQPSPMSKAPGELKPVGELNDGRRAISCYLKNLETDQTSSPITAIIDPRAPANFMSMTQELDLSILELEQSDPRHYEYSNMGDTTRLLGKALGVGWQPKEWVKPIAINFWIKDCYLDGGRQVILGQTFAREGYRKSSTRSDQLSQ